MGINIRTKGADAERDLATKLNTLINVVRLELGLGIMETPEVQRNQNQTAVGGQDLIGTYGLAIEVKRQEALSINTWWKQCVISANKLNEVPVLIFRQSRQPWRVITLGYVRMGSRDMQCRIEMQYDDFETWFMSLVKAELTARLPQQKEGLFP